MDTRIVKIFSTRTSRIQELNTSVETGAELFSLMRSNNIETSNMKMTESVRRSEINADTTLPTSNFTLFVTPRSAKGGGSFEDGNLSYSSHEDESLVIGDFILNDGKMNDLKKIKSFLGNDKLVAEIGRVTVLNTPINGLSDLVSVIEEINKNLIVSETSMSAETSIDDSLLEGDSNTYEEPAIIDSDDPNTDSDFIQEMLSRV